MPGDCVVLKLICVKRIYRLLAVYLFGLLPSCGKCPCIHLPNNIPETAKPSELCNLVSAVIVNFARMYFTIAALIVQSIPAVFAFSH